MSVVSEFLNSPESTGSWTLVPDQSALRFENTTAWGALKIRGTFTDFTGDGQIQDGQAVTGRVDIKAASVNTDLDRRDGELRSASFFDVDNHPTISIVVTGGKPVSGDTVHLQAEMTAKGVTAPLPLDVGVELLDGGGVRLRTRTAVKRKDFGVGGNVFGMLGTKTALIASLVFQRA